MIPYKDKEITIGNINRDQIIEEINHAVIRTNRIVTKGYMLMRYWIITQYGQENDIPIIDTDLIDVVFQAICTPKTQPRQVKQRSDETIKEKKKRELKQEIYDQLQFLNPFETEDDQNLSGILQSESISILTSIENNIKEHFIDYVRRFVNVLLGKIYKESLTNSEIKQFNKEIYQVKKDLLDNRSPSEYKSDSKYHEWIEKYRDLILPKINSDENYYYDVKVNPQKYLKCMVNMNLLIEKQGGVMYQFFPLRTEIIPKHITIDTKSLIEILVQHGNAYLYQHTHQLADMIWRTFFKIDMIKNQNYLFDQAIITDGYSVSVRMIHPNQKIKKEALYEKRLVGLKNRKQGIIKPEVEEKNKPKTQKKQTLPEFLYIEEVPRNLLLGKKLFIDPGKKDLLSLVSDDMDIVFNYTNRQRITETKRLIYQKELTHHRIGQGVIEIEQELSDYNSKTCDPISFRNYMIKKIDINMRTMESYNDPKYRRYQWYGYLNRNRCDQRLVQRIKNFFVPSETHQAHKKMKKKSRQMRKKRKYKKSHIQHLKNILDPQSKCPMRLKTEDPDAFLNQEIKQLEQRIQKLKTDIDKLRLEIVRPIIIIGDWSIGKQMRHLLSTPNIRLKRLLARYFSIYNIDEFRTSCIHHETENRCENLYLPDKTGHLRKIHSVLTYQMENQRLGCINRDRNGRQNIRKLFFHYMATGDRPERYRRGYELPE